MCPIFHLVCQFFTLCVPFFTLCVSFSILWLVVQIKVCQRFVCEVFVDSSHNSIKDHVKLDFPILSLSV